MERKIYTCMPVYTGILVSCFCFFILFFQSCTTIKNYPNTYVTRPIIVKGWIDWNVSLVDSTTGNNRFIQLQSLEDDILIDLVSYNSTHGTAFKPQFFVSYCQCDSSLYNFSVTIIDGSGTASGIPPAPPAPHGGSGDTVDFVTPNIPFETDTLAYGNVDSANKMDIKIGRIDTSKIIAIIDTGIDTAYFNNGISRLIWSPVNGVAMRDFTLNRTRPIDNLYDDADNKHGSAVTALALKSVTEKSASLPRLMVLKALDANKSGTTFTVSCAMSYAIQQHATLINASLGYYSTGDADPVLAKYLKLCNKSNSNPIYFVAAAGNKHGSHAPALLCMSSTLSLSSHRLFYPACFSENLSNVIAVTTISGLTNACYYQNYSNRFVDVGVLKNTQGCCGFPVPFLKSGYEGSSFAAPIVSGLMMGCLLDSPAGSSNCLHQISTTANSLSPIIKDGRYVKSPSFLR